MYYPLFLDLRQVRILLAGAGSVGRRKAGDILAVRPQSLLWLDPAVAREDLPASLRDYPALEYAQREAGEEDLAGCGLVFAATSSMEANLRLARACRSRGIFCNVADAPEEGNCIVPAHFREGDFALALSTGGQSPALAKMMRRELQDWYTAKYSALLTLLRRLRPILLGHYAEEESAFRADFFRSLAASGSGGLGEALRRKDGAEAARLLREFLPKELHLHIKDILHDLY